MPPMAPGTGALLHVLDRLVALLRPGGLLVTGHTIWNDGDPGGAFVSVKVNP